MARRKDDDIDELQSYDDHHDTEYASDYDLGFETVDTESEDDEDDSDHQMGPDIIPIDQPIRAPISQDKRRQIVFTDPTDQADRRPSPEERIVKGTNLQRFKAARLKISQPGTASIAAVAKLAKDLIAEKPLRKLHNSPFSTARNSLFVKPFGAPYSEGRRFSFRSVEGKHRKALIPIFCQLLEHIPCSLKETSRKDTVWLLDVAKKLAHTTNPDIRPVMDMPLLRMPSIHQRKATYFYEGRIRGIDPNPGASMSGQEAAVISSKKEDVAGTSSEEKGTVTKTWALKVTVHIGTVLRDAAINVPGEYIWSDEWSKNYSTADDTSQLDETELRQACRLLQLLIVTFNGYIGPLSACTQRMLRFQIPFRTDKHISRNSTGVWLAGPYRGFPLWYGPTPHPATKEHSRIAPVSAMLQDCGWKMPYISLLTHDKIRWYSVLCALINTLEVSSDPNEVWEAGTVTADEMNVAVRESIPPNPALPCSRQDRATHWHPCAYCSKARKCEEFAPAEGFDYEVCSECLKSLSEAGELTLRLAASPTEARNSALLRSLLSVIKIEASHTNEDLSAEVLSERANAALRELEPLQVFINGVAQPGKYHDGYVVQVLSEDAPTVVNWHGNRLRLNGITVDAKDPIHAIMINGTQVIGYHVPGNYTVTSFPMNVMGKHYPKVHYIGFFQVRNGTDIATYESGIAILFNCHKNQLEGSLNVVQQGRRIGHALPKNYAEVKASFRNGSRLREIHVPVERLWRYSSEKVPMNIGSDWRPPRWNYIQRGVREIAQHHGLDQDGKWKYWRRYDEVSGEHVPFFFNEYSVIRSWTPYDFMTWMSVRYDRMRKICDRLYRIYYAENPDLRPSFELEVFIFELAQHWMVLVSSNIRNNADSAWPEKPPGADSWGLPVFPTICMPSCLSVAHKVHGAEMKSGYAERWPESHGPGSWEFDRSGIEIETQAKNYARWSFPNEVMPELVAQLDNLRAMSQEQVGSPILRGPIIFEAPILKDELGIQIMSEDADFELLDEEVVDGVLQGDDSELAPPAGQGTTVPTIANNKQTASPFSSAILSAKANLGRIGQSCWASVVVQLIHNIPTIRELFQATDLRCLPLTGRPRSVLTNAQDTAGLRHGQLVEYLRTLLNSLDAATTSPLSAQWATQLISRCNSVMDRIMDDPLDIAITGSAIGFLDRLLSHVEVAMDRSQIQSSATASSETLTQQRLERFVNADHPLPLLQDASVDWQAYLDSGRQSELVKRTHCQMVLERHCTGQDCGAITRWFEYDRTIRLRIPGTAEDSETIEMAELGDQFLFIPNDYSPDDEEGVRSADRYCPKCRAELSGTYRRIVRLPELVSVEVNRLEGRIPYLPVKEIDRKKAEKRGKKIGARMNPVDNFESLSMEEWMDCTTLPSASYEPDMRQPKKAEAHQVVGMLLYKKNGTEHFVLTISEELKGEDFICFDDLQERPSYVDYQHQLSAKVAPILLIYKRGPLKKTPQALGAAPIKKVAALQKFSTPKRPQKVLKEPQQLSELGNDIIMADDGLEIAESELPPFGQSPFFIPARGEKLPATSPILRSEQPIPGMFSDVGAIGIAGQKPPASSPTFRLKQASPGMFNDDGAMEITGDDDAILPPDPTTFAEGAVTPSQDVELPSLPPSSLKDSASRPMGLSRAIEQTRSSVPKVKPKHLFSRLRSARTSLPGSDQSPTLQTTTAVAVQGRLAELETQVEVLTGQSDTLKQLLDAKEAALKEAQDHVLSGRASSLGLETVYRDKLYRTFKEVRIRQKLADEQLQFGAKIEQQLQERHNTAPRFDHAEQVLLGIETRYTEFHEEKEAELQKWSASLDRRQEQLRKDQAAADSATGSKPTTPLDTVFTGVVDMSRAQTQSEIRDLAKAASYGGSNILGVKELLRNVLDEVDPADLPEIQSFLHTITDPRIMAWSAARREAVQAHATAQAGAGGKVASSSISAQPIPQPLQQERKDNLSTAAVTLGSTVVVQDRRDGKASLLGLGSLPLPHSPTIASPAVRGPALTDSTKRKLGEHAPFSSPEKEGRKLASGPASFRPPPKFTLPRSGASRASTLHRDIRDLTMASPDPFTTPGEPLPRFCKYHESKGCNFQAVNEKEWEEHVRQHDDDKLMQCPVSYTFDCGFYGVATQIPPHVQSHTPRFLCLRSADLGCDKHFVDEVKACEHADSDHPAFSTSAQLELDAANTMVREDPKEIAEGEDFTRCSICHWPILTLYELTLHTLLVHKEEVQSKSHTMQTAPFPCLRFMDNGCREAFATIEEAKTHFTAHSPIPPGRDLEITWAVQQANSVERRTKREDWFNCQHCDSSFEFAWSLAYHVLEHHLSLIRADLRQRQAQAMGQAQGGQTKTAMNKHSAVVKKSQSEFSVPQQTTTSTAGVSSKRSPARPITPGSQQQSPRDFREGTTGTLRRAHDPRLKSPTPTLGPKTSSIGGPKPAAGSVRSKTPDVMRQSRPQKPLGSTQSLSRRSGSALLRTTSAQLQADEPGVRTSVPLKVIEGVRAVSQPIPCPRILTHGCTEMFKTFANAKTHAAVHDGERPHLCPVMEERDCYRTFEAYVPAKMHSRDHAKTDAKLRCSLSDCRQDFASADELEKHKSRHATSKLRCPVCSIPPRTFVNIGSYLRHLRTTHGGLPEQAGKNIEQSHVLQKFQPDASNATAMYLVQYHGAAAKWRQPDAVRFDLLYSFEVLAHIHAKPIEENPKVGKDQGTEKAGEEAVEPSEKSSDDHMSWQGQGGDATYDVYEHRPLVVRKRNDRDQSRK